MKWSEVMASSDPGVQAHKRHLESGEMFRDQTERPCAVCGDTTTWLMDMGAVVPICSPECRAAFQPRDPDDICDYVPDPSDVRILVLDVPSQAELIPIADRLASAYLIPPEAVHAGPKEMEGPNSLGAATGCQIALVNLQTATPEELATLILFGMVLQPRILAVGQAGPLMKTLLDISSHQTCEEVEYALAELVSRIKRQPRHTVMPVAKVEIEYDADDVRLGGLVVRAAREAEEKIAHLRPSPDRWVCHLCVAVPDPTYRSDPDGTVYPD